MIFQRELRYEASRRGTVLRCTAFQGGETYTLQTFLPRSEYVQLSQRAWHELTERQFQLIENRLAAMEENQ